MYQNVFECECSSHQYRSPEEFDRHFYSNLHQQHEYSAKNKNVQYLKEQLKQLSQERDFWKQQYEKIKQTTLS